MFFTLGVSLYTSRVVLNVLGVDDFGIYNLVGGIVVLFSFINSAMTGATQRFLNYEMRKNSDDAIQKVFSVSMNVHFMIIFLVLILSESIGLWFLNYKLNIPSERMHAANIVYQLSVLTFCLNILKVPYNAIIIAYEEMSIYAWLSIVEVISKLVIVLFFVYVVYDKLILYAILTLFVSILFFLIYRFYCRKLFKTSHYKIVHDKEIFKGLIGFSGWSLFGNMALISSNQGVLMIMNIFLGVAINAAMGIANQVNTAVFGFVSNFQMAFNPQIIKTFASGDFISHKKLIFQASKFSYYLLMILALPILFKTKYILFLWLKTVPHYTVEFTQLIIVFSLVDALSGPFWMSANAKGNIKFYQIGISLILILNLPLTYLILCYKLSPIYVFVLKIIINLLTYLFRVFFVKASINFSITDLYKNVYNQILLVSFASFGILYIIDEIFFSLRDSISMLVFFCIISLLICFINIFTIGITKSERSVIISVLKNNLIKM